MDHLLKNSMLKERGEDNMQYLKNPENLIKISYSLELLIIPLWIVMHFYNTTSLLIPFWILMFLISIIAVACSLKAKEKGNVNYKWSYRIGIILIIFTLLGIIVNTYFEFFFDWNNVAMILFSSLN